MTDGRAGGMLEKKTGDDEKQSVTLMCQRAKVKIGGAFKREVKLVNIR